jgi:hypothetical protein
MLGADAFLREAVAAALKRDVDGLDDVQRRPLEYDAFLAHRAVNRVSGYARVGASRIGWSMIEKITEGPALAVPYLVDNARREFRAYSSGLLDDLAACVRAPRVYGAAAHSDGRLVLLLEEVTHEGARPLDATSVLTAARGLGGLAGRWRRRVPREPWLFTGWIDRHAQPEAVPAGLLATGDPEPAVAAQLGSRLRAAHALIAAQPRVRMLLESLPQTLCHHDAVGANVFVAAAATVLVDWESVGPGPVGADLASLLTSSVRRGDLTASVLVDVFDDAVAAYAAAAREEDPSIAEQEVELGTDAAIALRWKLIADVADSIALGRPMRRGSLPDEPPEVAYAELVALSDVVLAAASRVLRL